MRATSRRASPSRDVVPSLSQPHRHLLCGVRCLPCPSVVLQPNLRGSLHRSLLRFSPRLTLVVVSATAHWARPRADWSAHIALLPSVYGLDILDRDPMVLNALISAS